MAIDFSIVLCTRNRASLLREALDSALEIDYPADRFELVLVDNGSTDATPDVTRSAADRAPFPLRYVFEPRPGLSIARNRGVRESRGAHVSFTDDDQLVDKDILREFRRVIDRYSARVVQGNIELRFTGGRPPWLHGELATVLGKTNDVAEGPANIDLYGGNMLLSREVLEATGAFREDLGKGASGYCEDIELTYRVRQMGEVIVYAPSARIYHVIGPDRSTPDFFLRNSFEKGVSYGLLTDASLLRFTAERLPTLLRSAGGAAFFSALGNQHRAILAQSRAANMLGMIVGRARQPRRG
ncbi:MAG: glycosyltransferase [Polyangiaceae bacterium]|nr:glycosyltransferase [Polyangiaceae bacterium]NUQ75950.1 glycosyltransferase [Polyangiaceae bacterium]